MGKLRAINSQHSQAVVLELEELLTRARSGEIIGFGYTVVTPRHAVRAGLAGLLAQDKWRAAGTLFGAAMEVAKGHQA